MKELDNFYLKQEEPFQSCLIALRDIILAHDENIEVGWKYKLPFFSYKGKMFCYLWIHKKIKQPYIGMMDGKWMEHPKLILEKRARIKIILFDPLKDLPIKTIKLILKEGILLHTSGKLAALKKAKK
jgi:hypothetical protein